MASLESNHRLATFNLSHFEQRGLNGNNEIVEITGLAGLVTLHELWLWGNPLSDIGPVSLMSALWLLVLDGTDIGTNLDTLSVLAELPQLSYLALGWNGLVEIPEVLRSLTQLNGLGLHGNQIKDLDPIRTWSNSKISTCGITVTDISPSKT